MTREITLSEPIAQPIAEIEPDPTAILRTAKTVAGQLAGVLKRGDLTVKIGGRDYVKCEGWTTCAAMMGVTAREASVTEHDDGTIEAVVELRRLSDDRLVGRGSAVLAADEKEWQKRPRYARRSMAVTRATGKACRLAFSWIMTMAGYEATPAEEMPQTAAPARQRKPAEKVLGQAGAARVLKRLKELDGRSLGHLRLEIGDIPDDLPLEDWPAAWMEQIKGVFEDWEAAAAASAPEEIPF